VSGYAPPPDYMDADEDEDLIKPKKLVNPVKSSKSHQDMHKELLMRYDAAHAAGADVLPRQPWALVPCCSSFPVPHIDVAFPPKEPGSR